MCKKCNSFVILLNLTAISTVDLKDLPVEFFVPDWPDASYYRPLITVTFSKITHWFTSGLYSPLVTNTTNISSFRMFNNYCTLADINLQELKNNMLSLQMSDKVKYWSRYSPTFILVLAAKPRPRGVKWRDIMHFKHCTYVTN